MTLTQMHKNFYFYMLDNFLDDNPDAEYIALCESDYSEFVRLRKCLGGFEYLSNPLYEGLKVVKSSEDYSRWLMNHTDFRG